MRSTEIETLIVSMNVENFELFLESYLPNYRFEKDGTASWLVRLKGGKLPDLLLGKIEMIEQSTGKPALVKVSQINFDVSIPDWKSKELEGQGWELVDPDANSTSYGFHLANALIGVLERTGVIEPPPQETIVEAEAAEAPIAPQPNSDNHKTDTPEESPPLAKPPVTKAEKLAAVNRWDGIPKNERPPFETWICENIGTNPDGTPLYSEKTVHGWRRYRNSGTSQT